MYRIHTGRLNRTSPTVSHRGDENNKQAAKKSTAYGLVRRGFHVGSPFKRLADSDRRDGNRRPYTPKIWYNVIE